MVTVISPTKTGTTTAAKPKSGARAPRSGGGSGGSGGDDNRRRGGGEDFRFPEREPSPARYRVMLGVLFAGIAMMFLSLTIAYLSLAGAKGWQPIDLPAALWSSTALILVSSVTFERARRAWRRAIATSRATGGAPDETADDEQLAVLRGAQRWLLATTLLGGGFIFSQVLAWRELVRQNLHLTSDRHSSFLYMLTGLHALHIIGGIAVLGYLLLRVRARRRQIEIERDVLGASLVSLEERAAPPRPLARHTIDAGAIYWHFVDGLWVYVLLLLLWG